MNKLIKRNKYLIMIASTVMVFVILIIALFTHTDQYNLYKINENFVEITKENFDTYIANPTDYMRVEDAYVVENTDVRYNFDMSPNAFYEVTDDETAPDLIYETIVYTNSAEVRILKKVSKPLIYNNERSYYSEDNELSGTFNYVSMYFHSILAMDTRLNSGNNDCIISYKQRVTMSRKLYDKIPEEDRNRIFGKTPSEEEPTIPNN